MPAIPIVVGYMAASAGYTALAAGGLTLLGTVAAGATLLGGVAMLAGTIKGGPEGAKWTSDGGMMAAAGSLGMNALGPSGMTEAGAADTAANQSAVANSTTGNFVDAGAAPTSTSTAGSDVAGNLMSSPSAANIGDGSMLSNPLNAASNTQSLATAGAPSALTQTPMVSTPASATAPTVNATGTGVTAGNDVAARTAATTIQPPSSSLTSNNNLMTLAGNAMQGYNNAQMTQAQMDAYQKLQTQRIQADQARFAGSQYNPLLTSSNK